MQRTVLAGVGAFSMINAAYMWIATQHWYLTIPGVLQTGPLNVHFARDVALAFLSSGVALIWAARRRYQPLAVFGAFWLVAHAVFHIWIWLHRGLQADVIALTNLFGIQLPAALALWAALTLDVIEVEQ